ncbi:hypothetical protein ASPBRDRAFT_604009 [Aspergillus brasiliensis CBS 101740]|uniref:Uncharacterized protein n=1 Tax=Aspergillus brasiliensis (strain CBS 101740 / IMI 381727 / IBT 21946) TaxID=767769 RepID=A0A1L9UHN6_ASPBC|nr:hypothetical protein ASPBRDRAFT_604009 [Aspergillus brasiliensis CBS 101740]
MDAEDTGLVRPESWDSIAGDRGVSIYVRLIVHLFVYLLLTHGSFAFGSTLRQPWLLPLSRVCRLVIDQGCLEPTGLWFIFSFFFYSAFAGGKGSEPGIGPVGILHDVAQSPGWCIAGRRGKEEDDGSWKPHGSWMEEVQRGWRHPPPAEHGNTIDPGDWVLPGFSDLPKK